MCKAKIRKLWFLTFALAGVAGCGQGSVAFTVPAVTSSVPTSGATAVPLAQAVSVTFNEAMNAATINTTTFLLAGPGGAAVPGVVTSSGGTATFTPSANLASGTQYTATVTTGAEDPHAHPLRQQLRVEL